jgi:exopolyphosphatase/guanosine-5'-triphosphate,3'-diphosphate pyrophosphatase
VDSLRRAVIDVGTNSVKLLVADIVGQNVNPVWEESKQTRLGQGFYETLRLQPEPIAKTAEAVAWFGARARDYLVSGIRVIATSAARDAVNAGELIAAIEAASGLKVDVISGEQEAAWAFEGATTDPSLANEPLLLLDVGGGSTEFIAGLGGKRFFGQSFPLGSVRLLESLSLADPPAPIELAQCRGQVRDFLEQQVKPRLQPALENLMRAAPGRSVLFAGTGGTGTILGRMEAGLTTYDRQSIEAARLTHDRVRARMEQLWSLPLAERRELPGLPKNRADVILTGTVIYEAILNLFHFQELRISTRGLRFAAVRA